MSCPTSRCLSTPEPALNAPGSPLQQVSVGLDQKPARRPSRARRGRRAATSRRAAGWRRPRPPRCPRPRVQFSTALAAPRCIRRRPGREGGGPSSHSPPASVDLPPPSRFRAEKGCWLPACRRLGIPNAPGSTLVASCRCSVCSRCCSQLSKAPCTGGRRRPSGAFAAAALLLTAFVAWELRSSHPMLDPRFFRIPASPARGRPLSRSSSSWRHVTMVQRRSPSSGWSACLWPSFLNGVPAIVPGAIGYGVALPVVSCSSERGSASRSALSSRPITRSLVSGKRCP